MKDLVSVCGVIRGRLALRPLLVVAAAAALVGLTLTGGVSGATTKQQQCETPVFQNGLELVFGRAKTRAAADRTTAGVIRVGFKQAETVQESCNVWKSVLRGIDSYDSAVAVQGEARKVKFSPTIECLLAQEVGQIQAIFGTRATLGELGDVVQRANSFGYVGLKTKRAPCGGYQAYVAGFTGFAQAFDFARTASQRTGLHVIVVKA
jgi:hypothetical protein